MIQIESVNVRGLRDRKERMDILSRAIEDKINILCLQETHLIEEGRQILKQEWNADYFISGKDRKSGGVMVIIDNNFEYIVHKTTYSNEGRFIILDIELPDIARFNLVNIYAPNEDSPLFFENLFQQLEKMNIKNLIITGDWNLVNEFQKDTLNYKKQNNKIGKSSSKLL